MSLAFRGTEATGEDPQARCMTASLLIKTSTSGERYAPWEPKSRWESKLMKPKGGDQRLNSHKDKEKKQKRRGEVYTIHMMGTRRVPMNRNIVKGHGQHF